MKKRLRETMEEIIQRIVAENGMRLLMERIPHVRSCSMGVWITRGSRHEPADMVGISHFLEHLVFKGTEKRSAREIAASIESVGGSIDAFTSREYTCFYAKVLDENMALAIDVLSDLLGAPTMTEENLEKEKLVVYEEIRNMEDTPDDLIHQLYSQAIWGDGPLGYPLLGTYDTVCSLNRQQLKDYLLAEYVAPNLIIAVAGSFEPQQVIDLVRGKFGFLDSRPQISSSLDPSAKDHPLTQGTQLVRHLHRDCQQTHLCMGKVSFAYSDPRRYSLLLLNNIIGGGMSSRLFQRVREEEGLAYAIYSFQQFYLDTGVSGVYVGVEPRQRDKVIDVIRQEYLNILEQGVTAEELEHSKNQLKGQLLMGLESTNTRMFRLANFEINSKRIQSIEEVIENLYAVSLNDLGEVARLVLVPETLYHVSLGPNHV